MLELTLVERQAAYRTLTQHYRLRAWQRNILDASPLLGELLQAQHLGMYQLVKLGVAKALWAKVAEHEYCQHGVDIDEESCDECN